MDGVGWAGGLGCIGVCGVAYMFFSWSDGAFVVFLGPRKTAKGPRKALREGGFQVKEYWTTPIYDFWTVDYWFVGNELFGDYIGILFSYSLLWVYRGYVVEPVASCGLPRLTQGPILCHCRSRAVNHG